MAGQGPGPGRLEGIALLPAALVAGLLEIHPRLAQAHKGIQVWIEVLQPAGELCHGSQPRPAASGLHFNQQHRRLQGPALLGQQDPGGCRQRGPVAGQQAGVLVLSGLHGRGSGRPILVRWGLRPRARSGPLPWPIGVPQRPAERQASEALPGQAGTAASP